jgi:hypothetical protein
MANNQYKAPRWAIELRSIYKFFEKDCREENRYGISSYNFHAGRLAIEAEFNCSSDESTGFFMSDIEPIESNDGTFGIVDE